MLADVQQAIETWPMQDPLILLCDFDGTLAELHPDPAAPVLTDTRRAWLRDIAGQPLTFVGIVSGRRIEDLRPRAPLPSHGSDAGLHGMEIERGGRRWQHPDLDRARSAVRELVPAFTRATGRCPGAMVEDKDASVAVHARAVSHEARADVLAMADACAEPWIAAGRLRRLDGSCVAEYLPNLACHMGGAVQWIASDVAARVGREGWVAFLGDDGTDGRH